MDDDSFMENTARELELNELLDTLNLSEDFAPSGEGFLAVCGNVLFYVEHDPFTLTPSIYGDTAWRFPLAGAHVESVLAILKGMCGGDARLPREVYHEILLLDRHSLARFYHWPGEPGEADVKFYAEQFGAVSA